MARIIKEEEHAARRKEILDVAQRLVQTRGYEQVTIQDILDELKISKGAFYHYFDSKADLLEAIIDRNLGEVDHLLKPIVQDPAVPALEKMRLFFDISSRWKSAHRDYILEILKVWYHDHNVVFRQKMFASGLRWISPYLTQITRQGIQEGTLSVAYPEYVGEILFAIANGLGDSMAQLILDPAPDQDNLRCLRELITTYTEAVERILGAPPGSLPLVDPESLEVWFETPGENNHFAGEALDEYQSIS
jgi:AcrR family transcriptional regulator